MHAPYPLLLLLCCSLSLTARSQSARHYEVLVDEFLPDPDPPVGLPSSSFIELKNVSGRAFNLRNWKIGTATATALIKKDFLLAADSFVILCPAAAEAAYQAFGAALGISGFPSLNHDAGEIILFSETGLVLHALAYDKSWYHNELKSAGGWSLEMIDLNNPCGGPSNWTASTAPAGGTPGRYNAVQAENPDPEGPALLRSLTPDALHVLALFSEPLDSAAAADPTHYSFFPDIGRPVEAAPVPPLYDRVLLTLDQPLQPKQVYTLTVQQLSDCRANGLTGMNSCFSGLPEPPANGDLIFNEILFNPPPYGSDYLELYNRSHKVIDLGQVFLAGRDATGAVKDPRRVLAASRLFFPGEYAVLTADPAWVMQHYHVARPEDLFGMSALPSMPDDQGTILLLDEAGEILDELAYDHHWHSPLLADEEGVSLERIRADGPTTLASNWTSAASDAGSGTPTYRNSESSDGVRGKEMLTVEPRIFSPDQDGYQDFCFIKYHLPAGGFMVSISVYDIRGRKLRQLANNNALGTDGEFRWDGLDDGLNRLPEGHYVICADLFSLSGQTRRYRLLVTLAGKH
jgi:hypothetical protein